MGAFLGGFFSERIEPAVLLIIFSVVILQGGAMVLLQAQAVRRTAPDNPGVAEAEERPLLTPRRAAEEATIGLLIGVLGGLVGLILGSLRLPAMLRLLRMPPRTAVGTNMAVGLVTGIAGLVGHLAGGEIDWPVLAMMGGSSAVGAYYGARLTGKLSPTALLTALGVILLAVAGAMFWQAAVKL